jgi:hypothetical protein
LGQPGQRAIRFGKKWKQPAEHFVGALPFLVPFAFAVAFPGFRTRYRQFAQSEPVQQPQHAEPLQRHAPVARLVPAFIVPKPKVRWAVFFHPFAKVTDNFFIAESRPMDGNGRNFSPAFVKQRWQNFFLRF